MWALQRQQTCVDSLVSVTSRVMALCHPVECLVHLFIITTKRDEIHQQLTSASTAVPIPLQLEQHRQVRRGLCEYKASISTAQLPLLQSRGVSGSARIYQKGRAALRPKPTAAMYARHRNGNQHSVCKITTPWD